MRDGLCPGSHSVAFLVKPKTTCLRMIPLTKGLAILHQLAIEKIPKHGANLTQASPYFEVLFSQVLDGQQQSLTVTNYIENIMCVYFIYVHMFIFLCTNVCSQRPNIEVMFCSITHFYFLFEAESITKPGAHKFIQTSCPTRP